MKIYKNKKFKAGDKLNITYPRHSETDAIYIIAKFTFGVYRLVCISGIYSGNVLYNKDLPMYYDDNKRTHFLRYDNLLAYLEDSILGTPKVEMYD